MFSGFQVDIPQETEVENRTEWVNGNPKSSLRLRIPCANWKKVKSIRDSIVGSK